MSARTEFNRSNDNWSAKSFLRMLEVSMLFLKHAASSTSGKPPIGYRAFIDYASCGPPFDAPIPTYYRYYIDLQIICEGPRKFTSTVRYLRNFITIGPNCTDAGFHRAIQNRDNADIRILRSTSTNSMISTTFYQLLSEDVRRNFQIGCL